MKGDMKEYILVLQTYNIRQTIKVWLTDSERKLMDDIDESISKQKGSIQLSIEEA